MKNKTTWGFTVDLLFFFLLILWSIFLLSCSSTRKAVNRHSETVDSVTSMIKDSAGNKASDSTAVKKATEEHSTEVEVEFEPRPSTNGQPSTEPTEVSITPTGSVKIKGKVKSIKAKTTGSSAAVDSVRTNKVEATTTAETQNSKLKTQNSTQAKTVKKTMLPWYLWLLLIIIILYLVWRYGKKALSHFGIPPIVLIIIFYSCGGGGGSTGGGSGGGGNGQQPPPIDTAKPAPVDSIKSAPPPASFALLADFPAPYKEIAINLQEKGVLPSNTPEQNSDAIEKYLNSIPVGTTPAVWAPHAAYYFARAIIIDSRPIHFFGDSGSPWALGTRFYFPAGVDGIKILRTHGHQGAIVQNISITGHPASDQLASGFVVRARAKIIGCSAKRFSHNGIDFWANIDPEGTDASGSLVFDCVALENAHDGFFAGRMDANAISFLVCDARDNGRYGFNDDSFLGNWFEKCMAHYNKAGDFFVRDKQNARSTFRDCYTEGGSPPSSLSALSTISGGLWGSSYTQ